MSEQRLTCSDCGREFPFTAREQDFYHERGYAPPQRCQDCREAMKARQYREVKKGGKK